MKVRTVRSKKPLKFAFLFLIILFLGVLLWNYFPFKIKNIEVSLENIGCTDVLRVKNEIQILGKNIFFINEQEIAEKLTNKFPCIDSASVHKKYPNKLEVIVKGRHALAALSSYKYIQTLNLDVAQASTSALIDTTFPQESKEKYVVDKNGKVFATVDESTLPIVYMPANDVKIGQQFNSEWFEKLSNIFEKLETFGLTDTMKAESQSLKSKIFDRYLLLNTKPYLVFNLDGDIERQLISLQLILQKAKMDDRNPEVIDLRFNKPVVKY